MRMHLSILMFFLLVNCDTAGLKHQGVAPLREEVDGWIFDIRVRDSYAEAIRRNSSWQPRMQTIADAGGEAIQRATGCRVAWLQGDPSVLLAGIECGPERPAPRRPKRKLLCNGIASAPDSLAGQSEVRFSCD